MSSRLELLARQRRVLQTLAHGGGEAALIGHDPAFVREVLARRHPENLREALRVFLPRFHAAARLDDDALRATFPTWSANDPAERCLERLVEGALGLGWGEPWTELVRLEEAAWRVKQEPRPVAEHVAALREGRPLGVLLRLRTNVVDGWRYPGFDPRGCWTWGPERRVFLWWQGELRQRLFQDRAELALALALGAT